MNSQRRTTKHVRQVITLMIGICILAYASFFNNFFGFEPALGHRLIVVILTIFAITFVLRRIARQEE